MVNYKYADLFNRDKAGAKVQIAFDGGVIENENIPLEKMEITESLCSGSVLQFGCCEASAFKIRIMNNVIPLIGKKLTISETLKDGEDEPFVFGTYKVYSDKPTADRRYRDIIAYDAMYDILHAEVAAWYNSLAFPMALKAFRDSFFAYMDIEQVAADLPNDSMIVEETIQPSELSGQTVIEAICEINGCFGHINRKGKFQYVFLQEMVQGVYPSNDLYPSDNLYPTDGSSKQIDGSLYTSCSYEDYTCRRISKLQIRQEENDIGAIAGTGDNCYIMEDNFLVYGMGAEDLSRVAENLLPVLTKVSYRPFSAEAKGNPCIEVGDQVRLHTRYDIVESYVLQRTLKGIQALKDSYTAEGEETCTENVNSVNKSIVQLRGKTNILTRTVEETRLEIRDIEKGLSSRIQQTAEQIQTELLRATASEGELSSRITQTAESITAEITRATNAESSLSTRITQTADSISSEVTRATNAESSLSTRITQTADSISSEVTRATNAESNLSSKINQTAEQIEFKVTKGNVSSQLSVESGQITIKSNRFVLESTNCSISADGTINAYNVDLSGKITASSGVIGGFTIGSTSLYTNITGAVIGGIGVHIGSDGLSCAGIGGHTIVRADGSAEFRTHDGVKVFYDSTHYSYVKADGITIKNSTYTSTTYSEKKIRCYSDFTMESFGGITLDASSIGSQTIELKAAITIAKFNPDYTYLTGSDYTIIGGYGEYLGFFGSGNYVSDKKAKRQSVSAISSTSSATASAVATKLNELLTVLKAYNLIA